MPSRKRRQRRMKNASGRRDAVVREFERRDVGADIASSGTAVLVHPERTAFDIMDELTAETERRRRAHGR